MKCPNCGAKFLIKDNTYQCKYCGYVEYIEKDEDELIDTETKHHSEICNESVEAEFTDDEDEDTEENYDVSKNVKNKIAQKKKHIKNTNYNGSKTRYDNNKIEIGDNLTFLLFLGFVLVVYIISYFLGSGY